MYQSQGGLTTGSAVISYAFSAFLSYPALLLYVPTADGFHVYQHAFQTDFQTEHLSMSAKVDDFSVQPPAFAPPLTPDHVTVESIDYLFSPNVNYLPTAIVRGVNQELYALTVDYLNKKWYSQQLQLPRDVKREAGKWDWEPSNLNLGEDNYLKTNTLLNLFLVSGGTLSVVRQVDLNNANKNSINPVYNPAVPLQGGLAGVSSQTRASASDELVVVDRDGNLEVLTKRSDGGWNANQIHLPATEPAEVSTYRVQLTLSDDWGTRVAAKPLQVTSSAPAIALLNGQSVTLSSTPVTFTTDRSGQVTIPIVADALSAPRLTVSGGGLTAPVTVSPSDPVNAYMTGTVTLNYLPVDGAPKPWPTLLDAQRRHPCSRWLSKKRDIAGPGRQLVRRRGGGRAPTPPSAAKSSWRPTPKASTVSGRKSMRRTRLVVPVTLGVAGCVRRRELLRSMASSCRSAT